MKVTLQDIASQMSVSASTVSRSLRHDHSIHPRTRALVLRTAMKMGYELPGQRSRRGKSEKKAVTIGALLPFHRLEELDTHPNELRFLAGISAQAEEEDVILNLQPVRPDYRQKWCERPDQLPAVIRQRACDAIILEGIHTPQMVDLLTQFLPLITVSWAFPQSQTDSVVYNNTQSVRQLVERAVGLGHRKMAWVEEYHDAPFYRDRLAGFLEGAITSGCELSDLTIVRRGGGLFEPVDGAALDERCRIDSKQIEKVVRQDRCTALLCANDRVAQLVIEVVEGLGLRVPEDVSVTGFDYMGFTTSRGNELTSVNPDFEQAGRAAVRLAVWRIHQEVTPPQRLMVPGQIVEGQTLSGCIASD